MRVKDVSYVAKGMVYPSFVDIRTGRRMPFAKRHNTLSYMSAEAVAAAFGGDPSYIPSRIGFIYGDQPEMPTGESSESISRVQDWDRLCEELGNASGGATIDVQVVGFSYSPTLGGGGGSGSSSGSGSGDYNHIKPTGANAVTFHAVSNSQDAGAVFGESTFKNGSYVYQCLLLGYKGGKYYILARASLKNFGSDPSGSSSGSGSSNAGSYLQKPKGLELALDWEVDFRLQ